MALSFRAAEWSSLGRTWGGRVDIQRMFCHSKRCVGFYFYPHNHIGKYQTALTMKGKARSTHISLYIGEASYP